MKQAHFLAGTLALILVSASARAEEKKPQGKELSREETAALFARLAEGAKTARTFQADVHIEELSGVLLTPTPLKKKGSVLVERPDRFRQEIAKPHRSLVIVSKTDLWIHFPAGRRAEHVDLTKGIRGRAGTTTESFMPWLSFDLEGLEKIYRVTARTDVPPKGVTIRKAEPATDKPRALALRKAYRIDFAPKNPKLAPGIAWLSLWVDGENPWPFKIEKETPEGDLVTTEFFDILLDAPLDPKLFEFTPPRRTKVVELSK